MLVVSETLLVVLYEGGVRFVGEISSLQGGGFTSVPLQAKKPESGAAADTGSAASAPQAEAVDPVSWMAEAVSEIPWNLAREETLGQGS